MYDIIFSDYDNTLYGKSGKISEKTHKSIQKYIAQGGKFVISTGRIGASILPIAKKLNLTDEIITSQGAEIYNISSNTCEKTTVLDREKVVEILKIAKERKYLAQCYCNNKIYADKNKLFNRFFTSFFGIEIIKEKDLIKKVENCELSPCKFEILLQESDTNSFVKEMAKAYPEFLFSKSAPVMVEIADRKATKGEAVKYVLNKYNIAKENAVAIGDGNNDITMLNAVGTKVAVGNSAKKLLSIADYVASDDGDAVSEIIEMILKGENIK